MTEIANPLDCMHDQQAMMIAERERERVEQSVRRLTPIECERLQGFEDGWTDIGEWTDSKGKKHKEADSPRYKAIGNSIALPFWEWMAKRIVNQYGRPVTMGSLFDGIGGFPLAFQRAGAEPVWASEIEEFCIAVTKKHFGDD
jgi:DNA (cytosine-5)-methyltransferase 1